MEFLTILPPKLVSFYYVIDLVDLLRDETYVLCKQNWINHFASELGVLYVIFRYSNRITFTHPQLVSNIEPSTCKEAIPKSATRMLFLSSRSRFSGFKSRWLKMKKIIRREQSGHYEQYALQNWILTLDNSKSYKNARVALFNFIESSLQ